MYDISINKLFQLPVAQLEQWNKMCEVDVAVSFGLVMIGLGLRL